MAVSIAHKNNYQKSITFHSTLIMTAPRQRAMEDKGNCYRKVKGQLSSNTIDPVTVH